MAKETAEQKLLKLIEASDSQQPGAEKTPSSAEAQKLFESVSKVGLPSVAVPAFLTQALTSLQGLLFSGKSPAAFGIREFNKLFILVLAIVGIFCVLEFRNGMKNSQEKFKISLVEKVAKSAKIVLPSVKDLSEYLSLVQRRNIFQPYQPKVEETEESIAAATEAAKPKIIDEVKDFKLVGISWLNNAASATAMIEDTSSTVTYFLKQGDQLRSGSGIVVKEIFADRVILGHEGEKIDLKLY